MKKNKVYTALIALLSCVSLVSVGYATWTISSNVTSSNVNGDITAENVIFSNDYVDVLVHKNLHYCNYGFIDESGSLTKKGDLSFALNFDKLDSFAAKYNTNKISVEVDFSYKNNNGDLFNNPILSLNSNITNMSGNEVTGLQVSTQNNIKTYKFDLEIKQGIKVDYYLLNFEWINNSSDFNVMIKGQKNEFYNKVAPILNTPNVFAINVKLNSKGGNK